MTTTPPLPPARPGRLRRPIVRRTLLAGILGLAVATLGAGHLLDGRGPDAAAAARPAPAQAPAPAGPVPEAVTAAAEAEAKAPAPAPEAAAAEPPAPAGGGVTDAELAAALAAASDCIDRTGYSVDVTDLGAGDYTLGFSGSSEEEVLAASEAAVACFDEHFAPVAEAYAALYGPTAAERAEAEQRFLACASAMGLEGGTIEAVVAHFQALQEPRPLHTCFAEQEQFLRDNVLARASAAQG